MKPITVFYLNKFKGVKINFEHQMILNIFQIRELDDRDSELTTILKTASLPQTLIGMLEDAENSETHKLEQIKIYSELCTDDYNKLVGRIAKTFYPNLDGNSIFIGNDVNDSYVHAGNG